MTFELEDTVLAETRAVRRELAERFGEDIDALCDFLIEQERAHQELLVNYPPNSPQYVSETAGASKRRTG